MKKRIGLMIVGVLLSINAQAENVMQADPGLHPAASELRMKPDVKLSTMKAVSECLYVPGATNDAKRECLEKEIEKVAQAAPRNE